MPCEGRASSNRLSSDIELNAPRLLDRPPARTMTARKCKDIAMLIFLLALHLLAVLFWVGGMAFAYWVLRPAAGPLDPPLRLALWRRVFEKFLPWVGIAIVVLLGSGYAMLGIVFRRLRRRASLHQRDAGPRHPDGAGLSALVLRAVETLPPRARSGRAARGRQGAQSNSPVIVAINLALGIVTVIVGGTGRYW